MGKRKGTKLAILVGFSTVKRGKLGLWFCQKGEVSGRGTREKSEAVIVKGKSREKRREGVCLGSH